METIPKTYLTAASALSLSRDPADPPALWYSGSLANPENWILAGKQITHTGHLLGILGLWEATDAIAQHGINHTRVWAASPERAVFDLLVHYCEIRGTDVANWQAADLDDVVDLEEVKRWIAGCAGFLRPDGRARMAHWLNRRNA